ncbi:winged helix-turn-helix domain-containing protein [Abyssisolibacter fermentans]|uniref:winged helix-turn-helix domain-containing protein n=1 Tax=Abyssisolibacter fermentans TaxID=1766203 RepID=UPI000830A675|nr:winged helix-turn-helix domain-containing protein [Abyssisolibacter fermentans]
MDNINNIYYFDSPVIDFLASMFRITNNKRMLKNGDIYFEDYKFDDELLKLIEQCDKAINNEMRKKLNLFFNWETYFGMCLVPYVVENDIQFVEDFISNIRNINDKELLSLFLGTGYTLEKEGDISIDDIINDERKSIEFINKNIQIPTEFKWDLLQFFINPRKMKNDLIYLFEEFYKIYKNIESFVIDKVEYYKNTLIKNLHKYGDEYASIITNTSISKLYEKEKVVFAVSYFYEYACLDAYQNKIHTYMIGYKYPEAYVEKKHSILSGVDMFKALGDETRLNIIRLLSKKKWYGKELAKELKLSNSTISHHLSLLMLNKIITSDRVDNRTYYTLNEVEFKKHVINAVDNIIGR